MAMLNNQMVSVWSTMTDLTLQRRSNDGDEKGESSPNGTKE